MQIDTFLFGQITINDADVLSFPKGLPAFENCTRFALIHEDQKETTPASFTLQSIDDPAIAFQIADPSAYGLNFELELSDEETELLAIEEPQDVAVMLVLFKRDDSGAQIEANLRAPILINTKRKLGMQKIIAKLTPNLTLRQMASSV